VLDHDQRVAGVAEFEEQVHEVLDVGPVQSGGGLVEDVERVALLALAELKRELDTLRLAAGERGGGLAEREVTETDGVERFEAVHDFRYVAKKHAGVAHGHVEHVGDGVAVKEDFERLAVEALALAAGTRRVGVGHELHVELDDAVALAAFATAA